MSRIARSCEIYKFYDFSQFLQDKYPPRAYYGPENVKYDKLCLFILIKQISYYSSALFILVCINLLVNLRNNGFSWGGGGVSCWFYFFSCFKFI